VLERQHAPLHLGGDAEAAVEVVAKPPAPFILESPGDG
jgi:hypothetical protein